MSSPEPLNKIIAFVLKELISSFSLPFGMLEFFVRLNQLPSCCTTVDPTITHLKCCTDQLNCSNGSRPMKDSLGSSSRYLFFLVNMNMKFVNHCEFH